MGLVRPLAFALAVGGLVVGCASPAEEVVDGEGAALSNSESAVVYFHGMSGLGFSQATIAKHDGDDDILAPRWTDAQLQAPVPASVTDFLASHQRGLVSGYSLGRIPVLHLMKSASKGFERVVMIDPTYDGSADLGRTAGGPVTKDWLDGDDARSFLLVYGDATKELHGEDSYVTALSAHPRAELCYVPGDHARFRQTDMVGAILAKDCADVHARLGQ